MLVLPGETENRRDAAKGQEQSVNLTMNKKQNKANCNFFKVNFLRKGISLSKVKKT